MPKVHIEVRQGFEIFPYIDLIAQMRMELFKEYPYLYEGNLQYERDYLKNYPTDEKSTLALLFYDDQVVGISTGTPVRDNSEITKDLKKLLLNSGHNPDEFYYYGEVLILPQYRGRRFSAKLYHSQDEIIKSWNYKYICILTVVRDSTHPLLPRGYKTLDKMWKRLNFHRTGLQIAFSWPTLQVDGTIKNLEHPMELWIRKLV